MELRRDDIYVNCLQLRSKKHVSARGFRRCERASEREFVGFQSFDARMSHIKGKLLRLGFDALTSEPRFLHSDFPGWVSCPGPKLAWSKLVISFFLKKKKTSYTNTLGLKMDKDFLHFRYK